MAVMATHMAAMVIIRADLITLATLTDRTDLTIQIAPTGLLPNQCRNPGLAEDHLQDPRPWVALAVV